ncbi:lipid-A-disaccharide synthase-related protein [Crocosphaera sp. UHCC 0190]|uniref:lipid-A-disaccharide synthase-related protein n=1 Tax=Crocosphaera sp. UHCC 0190 TaxID=3110246 RepID=UPI002B208F41|nr:lipid-A-disaccharide synthase-related protein [Crocosphaera sp. UHCC 0190]MEA5510667.1 lipid-A-disaccharide synthase-related protein [Crocosphaera sp. UHCC 0190]
MSSPSKRILFISNGHGEDNHSSYVIETLLQMYPNLEVAAMPIVGEGNAYRRLNVPIIGPTQNMPSGGFSYINRFRLLTDLKAGLVGLSWRQLQAVWQYAPSCHLIMATGDTVSQGFAYSTGYPYVSFISCLSALYEGKLNIGPFIGTFLRSPKCVTVFTRDPYTAKDLRQQGITKAQFGGIPSLDKLQPTGKDLQLNSDVPMVALLPGSRLPEAVRNFKLQLNLISEIVKVMSPESVQFRAALVPKVMQELGEIANSQGWQAEEGKLTYQTEKGTVQVLCYGDAFSDILHNCTLMLGMAGLAVDQGIALGKPVIQVPGEGPQFTYEFAEAQTRLIGSCAQTIGKGPATPETLREAAQCVAKTLADTDYLADCLEKGSNRFGPPGASVRIARFLLGYLGINEEDLRNVQFNQP